MYYETQIEEESERRLEGRDINTLRDFRKEIKKVFDIVCGEHGREAFFSLVIPRLKEIYRNNFKEMGLKALSIMDEGASKKPSEIEDYFSSVLIEELEKSKRNKRLSEIEKIICKTLLKQEQEFEDLFDIEHNVVGAIIYGSYATGNQHLDSDLDLFYLVRSEKEGFLSNVEDINYLEDFDPTRDIDFCEYFRTRLDEIRLVKDEIISPISIYNKERLLKILFDESEPVKGKFKVASPYLWVHNKIKEYIKVHKST